jgi:microcystin-dependent protein
MSQPFVGEIRMFAGNFAPVGWMLCQGQLLSIAENDVLFNLIGTTYGGDGQQTFALPDLRGRMPLHQGTGVGGTFIIGEMAGVETVTLTTNQIPAHSHVPQANTNGSANVPGGNTWAGWTGSQYSDQAPNALMASGALGSAGGSQPHDNMPPYLTINFIISMFGIFPSQT